VEPGDCVLRCGHRLRPQEMGIIASMGLERVPVFKRPLVGIITTGSEIVEPGNPLPFGHIYNSNAYSISAQVLQTGALVKYGGIVSDHISHIRAQIENLLAETQMVLISGGVSMGDYDFVPRVLHHLDVNLHFDKVAIQPGKPTVFGTRDQTLVFGLPGNPVSTFIIFEVFVKPLLYRLMGCNYQAPVIKGVMKRDFKRKHTERTAYVPVRVDNESEVEVLEYHGSAHLTALAEANALLKVPRGTKEIPGGSPVYVRQI